MLRLAISGCNGRMGKALIRAAMAQSKVVRLSAALVSPGNQLANIDVGTIAGLSPIDVRPTDNLNKIIDQFDVFIDFTTVYATLSHLSICQRHHKGLVIGTTGFTPEQQSIIQQAAQEIPIVFSPNMSIGINLCFQLVQQAMRVLGRSFDVEIIEAHHRDKEDAPSGTALKLGEIIAQTFNKNLDDVAVYERHGLIGPRVPQSIGFSTIRAGDTVGEHTIMFAGDGERIEITHRAFSRNSFALGAIRAAQWLENKAPGLYSMSDVLGLS